MKQNLLYFPLKIIHSNHQTYNYKNNNNKVSLMMSTINSMLWKMHTSPQAATNHTDKYCGYRNNKSENIECSKRAEVMIPKTVKGTVNLKKTDGMYRQTNTHCMRTGNICRG